MKEKKRDTHAEGTEVYHYKNVCEMMKRSEEINRQKAMTREQKRLVKEQISLTQEEVANDKETPKQPTCGLLIQLANFTSLYAKRCEIMFLVHLMHLS